VTWLARQARIRPKAVAVRVPDAEAGTWREVRYRELAARSGGAADRLAARNLGPDDRIAVSLPGTLEHLAVIHAIAWRGAVLVPLDPRLDPAERARRLAAVGAAALVGPAGAGDQAAGDLPCPFAPLDELAESVNEPVDEGPGVSPQAPVPRALDDLHSIVFTSGSTGRAEPVELTWGNHLASAIGSAFNLGIDRRDDWLCCLPLVHVGGLAIVLRSVLYGTALTLLDSVTDGFDPVRVAALLRGGRITLASLVPTMLRRVLEISSQDTEEDPDAPGDAGPPPGLRAILLGGGPAEPELIERAWRAGLPVLPTYGMTETSSQVVTLPLDRLGGSRDRAIRAGSAGAPLFGAEIAIRGGGTGEIQVRGPMVARSAPVDANGWLCTGDLGRIDEAGDLWVIGRSDQVIVTGGENVAPERVEAALSTHPAIAECAVTGVDDPEWGRAVAAALVPRDLDHPPVPAELTAWCREHLAPYEIPKHWRLVAELPRTAAGKPRRDALGGLFDRPRHST